MPHQIVTEQNNEFVGPPVSRAGSELVTPPVSPTGPTGLQRFAKRLGKAGISLATGIPAIELDRRIAENRAVEAGVIKTQQDTETQRIAAEREAELQRLSQIAFPPGGVATAESNAALNQIFALDPLRADRLFESIGARSQASREEAARDASAIQALPFEQRRPAILERAARIEAQGRDASDTLSLLDMDPETQTNQLRIIQAAALTQPQRVTGERAERQIGLQERGVEVQERGLEIREDELEAARSLAEATRVTKTSEQNLKTEEGLRKEVNTLLKDFFQVADANARVNAAGTNPSAAGDLALIFNYMKILDPGSTVREGEFANAQNSASVPLRIRGMYNSIVNGERLSGPQRQDFLDRAESLFKAATEEATKTANSFERIATNANVNVENVLATFRERSQQTDQPAIQTQSTVSPEAIAFLRANDTPENRAQFVQKFGALPRGF